MRKNLCIMLMTAEANLAFILRMAAVSAESGNPTVIYLDGNPAEDFTRKDALEKYVKLHYDPTILQAYQRFRAAGGRLWVSAYEAQRVKLYERRDLVDGLAMVDEKMLLDFLSQDTICLQY